MFSFRRTPLAALFVLPAVPLAVLLAACSDPAEETDDAVHVEASFYPLAWIADQVGAPHVSVRSLTKAGAEPHDLELTPSDVARVIDADLIVYLKGFQPAVDDAVGEADPDARFDAAEAARLDLTFTPLEGEAAHDHDEDEDHDEDASHDHDAGTVDPHFWLDPTRLAAVAEAVANDSRPWTGITRATTGGTPNASRPDCRRSTRSSPPGSRRAPDETSSRPTVPSVTSPSATTSARSASPASAPNRSPRPRISPRSTRYVQEHQVGTIFFETVVGPGVAEVVARETGAATAVLDPLEGLTDASDGNDYLEVMASNLDHLRTGLGCT